MFDLTDLKDMLNFLFTARGENKVWYWLIILTFSEENVDTESQGKK